MPFVGKFSKDMVIEMYGSFVKFVKKLRIEKMIDKTVKRVDDITYLKRVRTNSKYFTRKRKMPFKKLMFFMLGTRKSSTQTDLETFFDKAGEDIYMTQQSFSEARKKISYKAFVELFDMTVEVSYEDGCRTWNNYRVSAIDGSKIALPSDEILREEFGTYGAGKKAATAQGSVLYDVVNDVIIDAAIEPISTDERTLAERHIDKLNEKLPGENDLILFDRGYASFGLIKKLKDNNINFLMRVRTKFNTDIDSQVDSDGSVVLRQGNEEIEVRVIKLKLSTGETETLITDIWDDKIDVNGFGELYFMRWPIETKFDIVKNKLEIENFSGRTVEAIKQDFYATMYLTNIAAAAKESAQLDADEQRENKSNKHSYKINVNHEVGVLRNRFILALLKEDRTERSAEVRRILRLLSKKVVPVRKNRTVERNKNPRNAKFHHNKKSNC